MHHAKLIGEVVALTGPYPGFAVRVTRYPSGRKLPAPRLILCAKGHPFGTRYGALEALNLYCTTPRSVKPLKAADPVPVPPVRALKALPARVQPETRKANDQAIAALIRLRTQRIGKPLPEITKLPALPAQRLTKTLKKDALGTRASDRA